MRGNLVFPLSSTLLWWWSLMNGGVQNRLLAAFPPTHINQVVCCELVPEEREDETFMWLEQGPIDCLSGGTVACK